MRPSSLYAAVLIMLISTAVCAEEADPTVIHEKVQEALDWSLPNNPCSQPKAPGRSKEVRDEQGTTRTEWDVDGYTLARYERKEKRWKKCVDKYKSGLVRDLGTLKNSAQYGLTEQQATIILNKMKTIQSVLLSPDGNLPAATE